MSGHVVGGGSLSAAKKIKKIIQKREKKKLPCSQCALHTHPGKYFQLFFDIFSPKTKQKIGPYVPDIFQKFVVQERKREKGGWSQKGQKEGGG